MGMRFAKRQPRIVAVIVLYQTTFEESTTVRSMRAAYTEQCADEIEIVLWDNTPGERTAPANFANRFQHDPSNPGLAAAYNSALLHAKKLGAQWLLTLDQDTLVTPEYLQELLDVTQNTTAAAIVPRLAWLGHILSPFRSRSQGPALPLEDSLIGLTSEYLQAFNSGAALSVPFLLRIGGFDRNFPLDYLDHTTFARVHGNGGDIYILGTALEHELSSQTPGPLTPAALQRERSVLAAERRFVRTYGMPEEQRMYPVRMLRRMLSVLLHRRDPKLALLILRTLAGANR